MTPLDDGLVDDGSVEIGSVEVSLSADAAFEALFHANYDDLLRFAVRRAGIDSASDVVSDVFLVAWRRREVVPAGAERLWLFGVATKVLANEQRSQVRRLRLARRVLDDLATGSAHETGAIDAVVRSALASLSPTDQEALRLTEWEGLDIGEAARVAGCSAAAFRVRLHRARRHLAARLNDDQETTG